MSGEQKFQCADCGIEINEGEYKTFGVCDDCFGRNYKERFGIPEVNLEFENAALKESLAELIEIADYYHDREVTYTDMPYKNWTAAIDRAKKLIAENRE